MGKKSRLKRERRLNPQPERVGPDGLNDEERIVFNALGLEFELTHGRKPVAGDVLFDDGNGRQLLFGSLPAGSR